MKHFRIVNNSQGLKPGHLWEKEFQQNASDVCVFMFVSNRAGECQCSGMQYPQVSLLPGIILLSRRQAQHCLRTDSVAFGSDVFWFE